MKPLTIGGAIVLVAALAAILSCESVPAIDADFDHRASAYDALVEVPFITNRAIDERGGKRYFGNEIGALAAGRCTVGLDEGDEDGDLIGVADDTFAQALERLEPGPDGRIVVYFHGYYEDFERSCRRAATFKRRLGLRSGLVLFTWPANSTPLTYGDDVRDLEASAPVFLEVLDDLGRQFGHGNVSIIGHSLGARGLVTALKTWPKSEARYRDLVLVAGDIDRDLFVEALPDLHAHIDEVAVLVSDRDYALLVSETVNGAPRLGQSDAGVLKSEGVTVIDVTQIADLHFSGHVYHLRNDAVVQVIRRVLDRRPQVPLF